MDERSPLLHESVRSVGTPASSTVCGRSTELVVYTRRWYIVFIFSLLAFLQGWIWNTWGPIAASAEVALDWTDTDIALQANWGTITFLISAVFFAWLLDVKGLRVSCVIVMLLMLVGTGLRCITSVPGKAEWFINIASILNGFGGPVAMATPPLLSATWFPVHQRTRATAFGCAMNGIGVGISFILGPLFVHLPENSGNGSAIYGQLQDSMRQRNDPVIYSKEDVEKLRSDILTYMYAMFGSVGAVALAILAYFPAQPPTPPSITASIQRTDFLKGLKHLVKNEKFWLLGGAYALSTGVYNVWSAVLDVNLKPLGINEVTAGYIGFCGIITGNIVAVILSTFADIFAGRLKSILVILYVTGTVSFGVFALECAGIIPLNIESLYVLMIINGICLAGAVPLLFELICECTYPIAEGLTNIGATLLNNVFGLIFLFVLMVPMENKSWMNWAVLGATVVCIPVFILYRPRYARLQVDTAESVQVSGEQAPS